MARTKLHTARRWRSYKAVWALFAGELACTVPALLLFALAQPDLYRTRLWQDGYMNGFNSNPNQALYAIVNRVSYTPPIVWSQFITEYNVVISILSMFILLTKGVMFIMHLFWPIIGFFVHGLLVGLWGYSVWAQTSPDNTDPRFPKLSAPWYIVKPCSVSYSRSNIEYCAQAKGSLAVSVVMLFLFAANLALAIWSMWPTKAERLARRTQIDMEDSQNGMKFDAPPMSAKQKAWAHQSQQSLKVPQTPMTPGMKNPVTPRTMAFNRLGGVNDLPLRGRAD